MFDHIDNMGGQMTITITIGLTTLTDDNNNNNRFHHIDNNNNNRFDRIDKEFKGLMTEAKKEKNVIRATGVTSC